MLRTPVTEDSAKVTDRLAGLSVYCTDDEGNFTFKFPSLPKRKAIIKKYQTVLVPYLKPSIQPRVR